MNRSKVNKKKREREYLFDKMEEKTNKQQNNNLKKHIYKKEQQVSNVFLCKKKCFLSTIDHIYQ